VLVEARPETADPRGNLDGRPSGSDDATRGAGDRGPWHGDHASILVVRAAPLAAPAARLDATIVEVEHTRAGRARAPGWPRTIPSPDADPTAVPADGSSA
jgi:hypothetical protein